MFLKDCHYFVVKEDSTFSLFTAFNCGNPGLATNGQRSLYNLTTVNYTCDPGYALHGDSIRLCTTNGPWTGSVPQCNRKFI